MGFYLTEDYSWSCQTLNVGGAVVDRCTARKTGEEIISSTSLLTNIYIEPEACTSPFLVTYQQIIREGITARVVPQNPGEVNFAVEDPVFCHTAPLLKMIIDSNQVFEQSVIEYDSLTAGGSVTVPSGEQWIFFYRGDPLLNNVLLCAQGGGVWNQSENRCELPPTLWFICNGILTQQRDCVVQSNDFRCEDPDAILEINPDGTRTCVIYFNVGETVFNCPAGFELDFLPSGAARCLGTPEIACESGEFENGLCVANADPIEGAIPGVETDPEFILIIQIIAGALIIGGIIWFLRHRKK